MRFELKHCQTFSEAEVLAGNGWELVSVIAGAGFYFKKPVEDAPEPQKSPPVYKAIADDYRSRKKRKQQ